MDEAIKQLIAKLLEEIDRLMNDLEAKRITVAQWNDRMEQRLAEYHTTAYMLGQEDEELNDEQMALIAGLVGTQYEYLDGFAAAILEGLAGGVGAWALWHARGQLYAGALKNPYWRGRSKGLQLPFYPGDGSTPCLGNCLCYWEINELEGDGNADCDWRMSGVENHCDVCPSRAAASPYRIRDGVLV